MNKDCGSFVTPDYSIRTRDCEGRGRPICKVWVGSEMKDPNANAENFFNAVITAAFFALISSMIVCCYCYNLYCFSSCKSEVEEEFEEECEKKVTRGQIRPYW